MPRRVPMGKNERKRVGSVASRGLRDPGAPTNKIKTTAAGALTQQPDHKPSSKPTHKSPPDKSRKSAKPERLSAAEPDQTYQRQAGAIVVRGHFDAVTGLSTVTDAPSLGLARRAADE